MYQNIKVYTLNIHSFLFVNYTSVKMEKQTQKTAHSKWKKSYTEE